MKLYFLFCANTLLSCTQLFYIGFSCTYAITILTLTLAVGPLLCLLLSNVHTTEKRIPYKVIKVAMRCYGDKPRSFMQINPSGGIPVAIVKVDLYVHQFFTLLLFLFFPASLPLSLPYLPRPQLCNQFCCLPSLYFTLLTCFHLNFLVPFILA